jgi:outer membrane protein OmpA-like peptidoglycan-associated protein
MVLIMTKNTIKISLLALVLSGVMSADLIAQSSRLQYADKQFELANYRLAADEYSKSYAAKQDYTTASKAAKALNAIYAYGESYEWWKKAVAFSAEATKEDFAALVKAGYRSVSNYDPTNDLRGSSYSAADFDEFSKPGNVTKVAYRVYDLKGMDEFNSNSSDYSLTGAKSGIQYFASNRGDGAQSKKSGLRFDAKGSKFSRNYFKSDGKSYYGIYAKAEGNDAKKVTVEGYEVYHLSDPQPISNGKMIFSATPNKLKKRDQVIYPGVYYGTWDASSNTVKDVKPFPYNQTNAFAVISPRVDEEQKRLYFSSNRPGGQGGYDLYYVTWDAEMKFSEPVNLGPGINSPSNERDAFRNGSEFYFASDRKGGFGGLDVYAAAVQGNTFGPISNLGQPINSTADDFGFIKYAATEAYLASDRVGGKGYDDLYSVSWTDRNLKIMVVDQAGNSLKAGTALQLLAGTKTTDITGKPDTDVLTMVEKGSTYTFAASHPGYFNQKVTSTLSKDQEEITIVMAPIPYGLEVYQAIIYYDFDKDFLRELSKEKLDEITAYMSRHPELNLVIESHTDSRASDKYNQRLSERRAKSVTKYLEEKGINAGRVSAAWFSESKLVNDCGDGVPCPAPKHQLNRRSELKLIAFPEHGKSYEMPAGASAADFQDREAASKWFQKK